MEELSFEIKNKLTLKKHTMIRASCIQTKIMINIEVPNRIKDDVPYIRSLLIKEHEKIMERLKNHPPSNGLNIGDRI